MKPRIIALTGTPGTGKSAVAEALGSMINAHIMHLSEITKKMKAPFDRKRMTKIVPVDKLQNVLKRKTKPGTNIIEGHLAHLLKADLIIILRCHPAELARRLRRKKWRRAKIRENVEAELVGIVAGEAQATGRRFIEVDTTGKNAGAVAAEIIRAMKGEGKRQKQIDWLAPHVISELKEILK